MNAAVQGRGLDVGQTVGSGLASFLGESFARKIGEMRGTHIAADAQERLGFPTDGGVVDGVNFVEHKLLHGILGAATGALLDVNDPGRGALSGAFGGVVAETVAEALTLFKTEDTLVHYEDFCHENDLEPTREGCVEYVNAEMAQFAARMSENANRNADVADVTTALGAMMFNLDVNMAHEVARNAADNNYLAVLAGLAAVWGARLWTAYEVREAYKEGGVDGVLRYFEESLTLEAVAGKSKRVLKMGERVVKNGPALVKALCEKNPVSAGFIKSIEDKIIRHADRLLASNAGQLAAAGADGLLRMDAAAYRAVESAGEKIVSGVRKTAGKTGAKAGEKTLETAPKIRPIRGKDGKIKGLPHTQEHHIISNKHVDTKKHDLWKKAGVDPDAAMNKMLLPTKKGAELGIKNRSIHQGRHVKEVNERLATEMDKQLRKGQRLNWTQEQYKEALKSIIRTERQALKTGERKLNKHHRPWAKD